MANPAPVLNVDAPDDASIATHHDVQYANLLASPPHAHQPLPCTQILSPRRTLPPSHDHHNPLSLRLPATNLPSLTTRATTQSALIPSACLRPSQSTSHPTSSPTRNAIHLIPPSPASLSETIASPPHPCYTHVSPSSSPSRPSKLPSSLSCPPSSPPSTLHAPPRTFRRLYHPPTSLPTPATMYSPQTTVCPASSQTTTWQAYPASQCLSKRLESTSTRRPYIQTHGPSRHDTPPVRCSPPLHNNKCTLPSSHYQAGLDRSTGRSIPPSSPSSPYASPRSHSQHPNTHTKTLYSHPDPMPSSASPPYYHPTHPDKQSTIHSPLLHTVECNDLLTDHSPSSCPPSHSSHPETHIRGLHTPPHPVSSDEIYKHNKDNLSFLSAPSDPPDPTINMSLLNLHPHTVNFDQPYKNDDKNNNNKKKKNNNNNNNDSNKYPSLSPFPPHTDPQRYFLSPISLLTAIALTTHIRLPSPPPPMACLASSTSIPSMPPTP